MGFYLPQHAASSPVGHSLQSLIYCMLLGPCCQALALCVELCSLCGQYTAPRLRGEGSNGPCTGSWGTVPESTAGMTHAHTFSFASHTVHVF